MFSFLQFVCVTQNKVLSLFPITRELSKKRRKGNDFLFIKQQSNIF